MKTLEHLFYKIDGVSCFSYINYLRDNCAITRAAQAKLLEKHLTFCRDTVPMYKGLPSSFSDPFEALRHVPIFDKALLSAEAEVARSHVVQEKPIFDSTSGTTGRTFKFLITKRELSIRRAYEILANEMLGLSHGALYLQIWGGHEGGSLKGRIKKFAYDKIAGRTLVTVKGADAISLEKCVRHVNAHTGGILITYPSILYGLCRYCNLSDVLKTYKSIILTGEEVDYTQFKEYGLNNTLKNRYGSREFGLIALADYGSMHYFQSRFVLEIDEEQGLLVTDLEKKLMPMLRYPIGDFVDTKYIDRNLSNRIEQLFPLGMIKGRMFDILEGRSGTRYVGTFWTLLLRNKINVDKFRLVLRDDYILEVHYVGNKSAAQISETLKENVGDDFSFMVVKRDDIPELKNAKQKIIERIF